MIALDTNLLVRLLANDDEEQASRVAALLEDRSAFIPLSVLLETEWVFRSVYGLSPSTVTGAFRNLLGLAAVSAEAPGRSTVTGAFRNLLGLAAVSAEAPGRITQALRWYEQGFDFADALHLATAVEAGADALATFDGEFRQLAARHSALQVIEP